MTVGYFQLDRHSAKDVVASAVTSRSEWCGQSTPWGMTITKRRKTIIDINNRLKRQQHTIEKENKEERASLPTRPVPAHVEPQEEPVTGRAKTLTTYSRRRDVLWIVYHFNFFFLF